ncbi:MAG TPA: hypothetical protein VET88_12845 [Gammaproteobacteria bacterium]|nr:hypothetical protein [Gammaproteobacteria bacterium]
MANSFVEQLRRNAVALISLVVAVSSLSYNTWRNEATEDNRNLRVAAFEVLLKLGELQQVVFHVHYDKDPDKGNPRIGWAYVLTINDLARILPEDMQDAAAGLQLAWGDNWEQLEDSPHSLDAIMQALDATRNQTLVLLRSLE